MTSSPPTCRTFVHPPPPSELFFFGVSSSLLSLEIRMGPIPRRLAWFFFFPGDSLRSRSLYNSCEKPTPHSPYVLAPPMKECVANRMKGLFSSRHPTIFFPSPHWFSNWWGEPSSQTFEPLFIFVSLLDMIMRPFADRLPPIRQLSPPLYPN